MDTYTSLNVLTRSMTVSLAHTAKEPSVARETAYYQSKIGTVKNIDDFLKDTRLFNYAMKAWGLEDMSYAKGLIKKVLQGGIFDPKSPANTLASGRFKEFATVFNFQAYGPATTTFDKVQKTTVDNYVRQQLESGSGDRNPALKLALYFQRKAPSIKSAYHILADKNLLSVVQTALNIPKETGFSSIDAQAALINQKLKVTDLQDPIKLNKFLQRFAVSYDAANGTQGANATALMPFGNSVGLNSNLLMSIQKIR